MAARSALHKGANPEAKPSVKLGDRPSESFQRVLGACSLVIQLLIFCGGYYLWPSLVPVPKARDFDTKAVYTLRCLLPPLLALAFAIVKVAMMRFLGYAKNPMGKDELIQKDKNFLQNTLEQLALFLLTVGAVMTYLEGEEMRLIPLHSFTFFIGRILYRLGYPDYRIVGFFMTVFPSGVLGGLTVYFMFTRGFDS